MKIKYLILSFCLFSASIRLSAQDVSADSLLSDIDAPVSSSHLLPKKMMLSQRIFWGENGVFRKVGIAKELTPENRQHELSVRRTFLKLHPAFGFLTAAGMIAQGVIGTKMYNFDFANKDPNQYNNLVSYHKATAMGVNIAYGTTALLAFIAPPKQLNRKGVSNIKVHRALSYIHLSGMVATNVLARKIKTNPDLQPIHRTVALTTFGSFTAAMTILKFEF